MQKVTWLLSSVTAPLRARALPDKLAPVVRVMLVSATMLPGREEPVPKVAELLTCQNTPQPGAPLMRRTEEPLAVVSVLPTLKMKTAFGLPCASSVSVPVNAAEVVKQYTPGVSVKPPKFWPVESTPQGVPASVLYKVVSSLCACEAVASAACY